MQMRKGFMLIGAMFAAAAASGIARADNDETMARNLALFERFAGPPVEEIRQFRFNRWQPLGDHAVAVWSQVADLYLIEVENPCAGLDWARSFGITSTQRVVSVRFDYITFDRQRCHITRIRPVDEKAMRAEEYGASERK
jgi:hypothetical protein